MRKDAGKSAAPSTGNGRREFVGMNKDAGKSPALESIEGLRKVRLDRLDWLGDEAKDVRSGYNLPEDTALGLPP